MSRNSKKFPQRQNVIPEKKRRMAEMESDELFDDDLAFTQTVNKMVLEESQSSEVIGTFALRPSTSNQECTQANIASECQHKSTPIPNSQELQRKDGEISILRQNLHLKDEEILKLKINRNEALDAQLREHVTREKRLKEDITRLKAELKFSEQESLNLTVKCKELSDSLSIYKSSPNPSDQKPLSSSVSKITKTNPVPTVSPKRQRFLSTQEFSTQIERKSDAIDKESITKTSQTFNWKLHKLDVRHLYGTLTGQEVVSLLLQVQNLDGRFLPSNIVNLFQKHLSAPLNFHYAKIAREQSGLLLSPKLSRLKAETSSCTITTTEDVDVNPSPATLLQAVEGLQRLLSKTEDESDEITSQWSENSSFGQLRHASLLLPLITENLSRYLNILQRIAEYEVVKSSLNLSKSSSTSPSSESVGSPPLSWNNSLQDIFNKGTRFFEIIESSAMNALNSLQILANHCPSVRTDLGDSSKTTLLQVLVNIANPVPQKYNKRLVELALDVIFSLSVSYPENNINELKVVATGDYLPSCLVEQSDLSLSRRAVCILSALTPHPSLLPLLCRDTLSEDDDCLMSKMYKTCIGVCRKFSSLLYKLGSTIASSELQNHFSYFCSVISAINSVLSSHNTWPSFLLPSHCLCASQVVECLIMVMYCIGEVYRITNDRGYYVQLMSCLSLLHLIYQADGNLIIHISAVKHEFICVLFSLESFVKSCDDKKHELSMIYELMEYDKVDYSQDSLMDTQ